jgi:hypothetical protein
MFDPHRPILVEAVTHDFRLGTHRSAVRLAQEISILYASLSCRCCPIAPMRDTPSLLILAGDPRHLYL